MLGVSLIAELRVEDGEAGRRWPARSPGSASIGVSSEARENAFTEHIYLSGIEVSGRVSEPDGKGA